MIICQFNDPHLPYAIASLKRQSKNVDIILVDDGSDRKFRKVYSHVKNVKIIELAQNKGIGHARNVGLSHALQRNYDFIGFLDSDGIAHPLFVEEAVSHLKSHKNLLGVAAKKGIANPDVRIARVKYRYKIYKKDGFQLDCSLFKAEAFENKRIPDRRAGEDSVFILLFKEGELSKLNLSYFHFERESIQTFLRDEFYGAYYSYKTNITRTLMQLLITPYSSVKMILTNHWILEGLLFPLRQFIWLLGYLLGSSSER
jgi:glycosyltransferase involved in cell wall biosynthesis